jgi:hypothetical protein
MRASPVILTTWIWRHRKRMRKHARPHVRKATGTTVGEERSAFKSKYHGGREVVGVGGGCGGVGV